MRVSKVTDFRGTDFALAFAETAISLLVRQRSGTWERLDQAPVASGHLNAAMAQMRLAVPGDGKVHVFLPPEHVLSCRIPPGREVDVAAQFAARAGCDADSLAIVHWCQPATGQKLAIAADRTTIAEAAAYAVSWGFRPVSVGVHPETMPDGAAIRFPFEAPRSARHPARVAAAIGALILIGGAVLGAALNWPTDEPRSIAATETAAGDSITTASVSPAAMPEPVETTQRLDRATEPVLRDTDLPSLAAPRRAEPTPLNLPLRVASGPDRLQPASPRVPARTPLPAIDDIRPRVRDSQAAGPLGETGALAGAPVLAAGVRDMAGGVRVAALTPAEAPVLSDARPLVAIAPAAAPDDARASDAPAPAAATSAPGIEPAAPPQTADTADEPAPGADSAGEPVPQAVAPLASIEGPRSFAPLARPEGLVSEAWRALAAAPRSPRPQTRPAAVVRRVAALREARAARSPASADVAALATVSGTLPVEDAGLLGIVTQGNRREAIVMLASGEIARVGNGDRVGGWTVASINDDYIRLTGSGERRTLRLIHR
jgi:hypothetical protein